MDLFPYAWFDVALVHFLCALPLSVVTASSIRHRLSTAGSIAVAGGLLALGSAAFLDVLQPALGAVITSYPVAGSALRILAALALTSAGILTIMAWARPQTSKDAPAIALVGIALLIVAPASYIGARNRHDLQQLGDYLGQSRFGEAQELIRGLLILDAQTQWNGQPLLELAADFQRTVAQLESSVAQPLPPGSTNEERLARAGLHAMLGRSEAALALLDSIDRQATIPDADNLRGTILESGGNWEAALHAYARARAAWESRPPSDERYEGLLQATKGIAYCQRKSGRYAEAGGTYQQVLALAPTADSHFLLAQFYDDAQHASQARHHARQAMTLDPARYQQRGAQLLNKLAVYHFGCLGVFRAETARAE